MKPRDVPLFRSALRGRERQRGEARRCSVLPLHSTRKGEVKLRDVSLLRSALPVRGKARRCSALPLRSTWKEEVKLRDVPLYREGRGKEVKPEDVPLFRSALPGRER